MNMALRETLKRLSISGLVASLVVRLQETIAAR